MTEPDRDASNGPLASYWDEVIADAEAIAEEYRVAGWEVLAVEPGDVTPVDREERVGLSVLVPGDEYDSVAAIVGREGASFDRTAVYNRRVGETVFAVAVERDDENEIAVVVPLYYDRERARSVAEGGREAGALAIHVRPLSTEEWVTFAHDDPSPFLPDDGTQEDDSDAPVETDDDGEPT